VGKGLHLPTGSRLKSIPAHKDTPKKKSRDKTRTTALLPHMADQRPLPRVMQVQMGKASR